MFLHSSSIAQTLIIRALDSRMSSISQHISTDFFRENEHHIWCNKHSFQLETTYRTFQCAVPNTEVSLFLYRSHGQSKYAVFLPTRRRMYRSSTCVESWRFCPTAFLLRSGEFIPRHPVHIRFSRCIRGFFSPHPLFVTFSSFERKKVIEIFSACQG